MWKFIIVLVAGLFFLGFAYEQFDLTFGEPEAPVQEEVSDSEESVPEASEEEEMQLPEEESDDQVFCAMDVRQCPDGSYVGRTGPNCEFVCPQESGDTEDVVCTMDAMECPDGSYVGRTGPNCEFVCPE